MVLPGIEKFRYPEEDDPCYPGRVRRLVSGTDRAHVSAHHVGTSPTPVTPVSLRRRLYYIC